ncbi:polysaccharide deacetylase family protein [candidate division KSB1 bacterium]|nr:polysaccharide deacetylase family protein [candidate division KSB1 bacterium]
MNALVPILVYHKIDPRLEWGITRVSPTQFERHIEFLARSGYQTISFYDLFQKDFTNPNQKKIILTFDDAYQSIYQFAFPILNKYKFSASLFIISDFVGRHNRWDINLGWRKFKHLEWKEINSLVQAGWELGSHSSTHPDLRRCSEDRLCQELAHSKHEIQKETGQEPLIFSYPFGRYNVRIIQCTKDVGYQGACTMHYHPPDRELDPYQLPRQGVYWWDTLPDFRAKLTGGFFSNMQAWKQRLIAIGSFGTIMIKMKSY